MTLPSLPLQLSPPRPVRATLRRNQRPHGLYDLTLPQLEARLVERGFPAYRARQVWGWTYRQLVADYDAMRNIPADLRETLAESLPLQLLTPVRTLTADDGETIKMLFSTGDGQLLETVLMLYPDRATVCVSCQVGCAVGCAFCATGLMGLTRNLSAGEMVAQVVDAVREARGRGRSLTNVVMMGMGEPLQNYADHRWDRWTRIMEMVPVGVLARPGQQLRAGLSPAARRFARWRLPPSEARALPFREPPAWSLVSGRMLDLSSSELRALGKWRR